MVILPPKNSQTLKKQQRKLSEEEESAIAKMTEPGGEILPRYPSRHDLQIARLPSPPILSKDANEVDAFFRCLRAYRGAVGAIFDQDSFVLANITKPQKTAFWKPIKEAVEVFKEFEIAPAAWALFSCDVWRELGNKEPPPLAFVFSAKRIRTTRKIFQRSLGDYSGGTLIFADIHRECMARFKAIEQNKWRVLLRLEHNGDLTVESAREALCALVDSEFPGGHEKWYREAQEKGRLDQARLKEQVDNGEFVWDRDVR